MKFYKVVLAAFIGTLIALLINFFVKVGVVSAMISNLTKADSETSTTVKPNSVLYMKLDYSIPDRTSENPFGGIDFNTMETQDVTGMNEILRNIEHAKTDANIKGIYLELSSIPTSTATLQEIRDKLIEQSGKILSGRQLIGKRFNGVVQSPPRYHTVERQYQNAAKHTHEACNNPRLARSQSSVSTHCVGLTAPSNNKFR